MASISDIINRWVREVRKPNPRYLRSSSANVFVHNDRLWSYGTHFELGRWVPATGEHQGFWLLNGDTYSVSTSRHQSEVRAAVEKTGEQVVILPYTTLRAAGIERESVIPVHVTADRWVEEVKTTPLGKLPDYMRHSMSYYLDKGALVDNGDGTYQRTINRHVLGESVIRAEYETYVRERGYVRTSAYFLSAFDHQETNQHYFLCQLPAPAATVEDAFQLLRPVDVQKADAMGTEVTRQGDIFGIPAELITTRELRKSAVGGGRMHELLGTSHIATEVIVTPGEGDTTQTWARGVLRHRPGFGRAPEHRQQKLGDGRTWHMIQKNTVPVDERGQNRAWSVVGNVD